MQVLWVRVVLGKHACNLDLCWAMASWRLLLHQSQALLMSLYVAWCPRFLCRPAMLCGVSTNGLALLSLYKTYVSERDGQELGRSDRKCCQR